jgi:hypothetical protein
MASMSRRVRVGLVVAAVLILTTVGVAFGVASQRSGTRASSTNNLPAVADADETATTTGRGIETTIASTTTTLAPAPAAAPSPSSTAVPPVRRPATGVPSPAPPSDPSTVTVPNVAGMRLSQATSAMAAVGLNIGWLSHCDDVVTSQSPAAGTRVGRGTRVAVELVPCLVPNVVGMRLEAAKGTIAAAGLRSSWADHCDDLVLGQSPAPGTRVDPGATVSVQLAAPGSC